MNLRYWLIRLVVTAILLGAGGLGLVTSLPSHPTLAAVTSGNLYAWGYNASGQLGDGSNTEYNSPEPINGVTLTSISAGSEHNLAIGTNGNLYAWGYNASGQLGDGSTIKHSIPELINLPNGVKPTTIAAGYFHSLAIGNDNNLYAWGYNASGQLGDGFYVDHNSPELINLPNGVKFTTIAAGSAHSLAIANDGNLYAWGSNNLGQLGDGSNTTHYTPELINLPNGAKPTAIFAGEYHSLAIGNDNNLYAWGYNAYGQLGNGSDTGQSTPQLINLPNGIKPTSIGGGSSHSLAIGNDGNLYAWGFNNFGQLGDGSTSWRNSPELINLPNGVKATTVAGGGSHSLAIGTDGNLYAWGYNYHGQLGDGSNIQRNTPQLISGVTPIKIAAGYAHSLAILPPPTVSISNVSHLEGNSGTTPYTFTASLSYATSQTVTVNYATADGTATVADNDYQPITGTLTILPGAITTTVTVLVNGDTTYEPGETFTLNLSNPTGATLGTVSSGSGIIINDDTPAGASSGVLYSWGNNTVGELGNDSPGFSALPGLVNLPAGITPTILAQGYGHNLVTGSDGKLYEWGSNYHGQLGIGSTTPLTTTTPLLVSLPPGVSAVAMAGGEGHSLAIGSDNKLYAWGWNQYGQLGIGSTTDSALPVVVNLPAGVSPTAIAAGRYHSLAAGSDGKLYAWGYNLSGQLGNGSTISTTLPVMVNLPNGVSPTALAAGIFHSLAVGSDGQLYGWGFNRYGQVGAGYNTIAVTTPLTTALPSGVSANFISAGSNHSLALGNDGKLYVWGSNNWGQLGDGSTIDKATPEVIGLPGQANSAILIAAGGNHSLVAGSDGKLYAWGYNYYGELGNGTITNSLTPVPVKLPVLANVKAITSGPDSSIAVLPPPQLSIANVSQLEGNSGATTPLEFTVSLSYATNQTATVNYATADGTATVADNDYVPTSGTLTIPPGVVTGTLTVLVNGDTKYEPDETFTLALSSPTGAVLGSSSVATGTILNDDVQPAGSLFAWGANYSGQLGSGTNITGSTSAVLVNLPPGVAATSVASGSEHTVAIGSDSKLYEWGNNHYGQLGNGSTTQSNIPVAISLGVGVTPVSVAAGENHTVAIGSDNKLYEWGDNQYGQLGNGSTVMSSTTPVVVNLPAGVRATTIAAGYDHNLAIGSDSKLYAWGYNSYGQLGNGTTTDSNTPVMVNLPAGVTPTAIAAGYLHSLAIGSDGKLYAWGINSVGQLGNGTNILSSSTPLVVSLPAGVTPLAISAGYAHSLATGSDGKLYSWGSNQYGELGNGSNTNSNIPVIVNLPVGVTPGLIATQCQHNLAVGSDGKLYGWGANSSGQLGDGTTTDRNSPVVVNLPAAITPTAIATGRAHSLAILPASTLTINNVTSYEGNSGITPFQFTVSLSYAVSQTVTVNYATADGTATVADNDYVPISGTLTIPAGTLTGTLTVAVSGDSVYEPDETFKVNLSNPVGAIVGTATGTGTILNDDNPPCNPLIVTSNQDDGSCGTLRAALAFASSSPTKTVSINLTAGSVISLTTGLTLTSGVSITTTTPCGAGVGNTMLPPVTIQGLGAGSGNGLTLSGSNQLYGLWVRGFSGVQIKAPPGSFTKMQCVKASKL